MIPYKPNKIQNSINPKLKPIPSPELINILTRSEKLWNEEGKQEESLVQLRKAISILEFIVANEAIESVKTAYEEKLKELRGRLKDR